jgi:hypothetical protein
MKHLAVAILASGASALSSQAQTSPDWYQQFNVPLAPDTKIDNSLRKLLKSSVGSKACSIPLLVVPVPKNLKEMPVINPRIDNLEPMPVKTPAPVCEEAKR